MQVVEGPSCSATLTHIYIYIWGGSTCFAFFLQNKKPVGDGARLTCIFFVKYYNAFIDVAKHAAVFLKKMQQAGMEARALTNQCNIAPLLIIQKYCNIPGSQY
jgi:hypothetical protein